MHIEGKKYSQKNIKEYRRLLEQKNRSIDACRRIEEYMRIEVLMNIEEKYRLVQRNRSIDVYRRIEAQINIEEQMYR